MDLASSDNSLSTLLEEILVFFHKVRRNCNNYHSLGECCGLVEKGCDNAAYCKGNCLCHIVSSRFGYSGTLYTDGQMLNIFVKNCFPKNKGCAVYDLCDEVSVNNHYMPVFLDFASRIREYDQAVVLNVVKKYMLLDKLNN